MIKVTVSFTYSMVITIGLDYSGNGFPIETDVWE